MGIFSDKYKAYGSISVNQISEQRPSHDTYYGELMMMHTMNGRGYTDELINDIHFGVTATLRKYRKVGKRYGFNVEISDPGGPFSATTIDIIKLTYPTAIKSIGKWEWIKKHYIALAEASKPPLDYTIKKTDDYIGYITRAGEKWNVVKAISNGQTTLKMNLVKDDDGTIEDDFDTGIPIPGDVQEGFGAIVYLPGRVVYYFSTDTRLKSVFHVEKAIEALPVVSLKDNDNNEKPYYTLPRDDPRFIARKKTLDTLSIDFEEMSKQIFDPDPIPDITDGKWLKYKKIYNSSEDLKKKISNRKSIP